MTDHAAGVELPLRSRLALGRRSRTYICNKKKVIGARTYVQSHASARQLVLWWATGWITETCMRSEVV
jgi:hypothetical protein